MCQCYPFPASTGEDEKLQAVAGEPLFLADLSHLFPQPWNRELDCAPEALWESSDPLEITYVREDSARTSRPGFTYVDTFAISSDGAATKDEWVSLRGRTESLTSVAVS